MCGQSLQGDGGGGFVADPVRHGKGLVRVDERVFGVSARPLAEGHAVAGSPVPGAVPDRFHRPGPFDAGV